MKKNNNQGFSLVELLIAIAILAILMVGVASFMSRTTHIYTRTRNDIELQKTGQEVYNLISDKIMQASEIRIGYDGKEYVAYGTNGSNLVDAQGRLYIKSYDTNLEVQIQDLPATSSGRALYAFSALKPQTGEEKKSIDYICILYEQKSQVNIGANSEHKAINNPYQQVMDIYYFIKPEGSDTMNIYLYRLNGAYRLDSVYNPTDADKEVYQTENTGEKRGYVELGSAAKWIDLDSEILKYEDLTSTDSRLSLVCENVTGAYVYAVAPENALNMVLDFEKQSITNTDQGMITLRNSGVLQPKNVDIELYNTTEDSENSEEPENSETPPES